MSTFLISARRSVPAYDLGSLGFSIPFIGRKKGGGDDNAAIAAAQTAQIKAADNTNQANAVRDASAAESLRAQRDAEEAAAASKRAWEADQVRREIEFQIAERAKAAAFLQSEIDRLRTLVALPASTADAIAAQQVAYKALMGAIDALNGQIEMMDALQRSRQSGLDDAKVALEQSTKTFSANMHDMTGRLSKQMVLIGGGMVLAAVGIVMLGRQPR